MKKLKNVLITNAIFSILSGLIGVILSGQLAIFLAVENHYIILGIGVGLVLFGFDVLNVALKKSNSKKRVGGIIIADLAWVFGSVLLLIIRPVDFSTSAMMLIALIAVIVLTFGLLQHKYQA